MADELKASRDAPADVRLHGMMFFEYGIKALWLPMASFFLMASVATGGLGFTESQKGLIIGLPMAIGAFCSPLIGQLADRYFPTQKCLAVLLLFAGLLKFATAYQTTFSAWLGMSILFAILYMPTISLTNGVALHHLPNPKRQFPGVRVWGTISWIVMSWGFPMLWLQRDLTWRWMPPFLKGEELPDVTARMIDGLKAAGIMAILFALFCWFVLPHTPPRGGGAKKFSLRDIVGLLTIPSFAPLLLITLIVSVVHAFYFMQMSAFLVAIGLDKSDVMPAMSLGQFSEILALAVLGWGLSRFGFRNVMAFGAACYFIRYAIFAVPGMPVWVYVAAQAIHGLSFGCYFAAGFIYVDRIAPKDLQHTAQTLYVFVMLGAAPAIAGWLSGQIANLYLNSAGELDAQGFAGFWRVAAGIALAAVILFLIMFRDTSEDSQSETETAAAGK